MIKKSVYFNKGEIVMRIGTIGTGRIVDDFLAAVELSEGIECVAMYSRKRATAEYLSEKYNVKTIYTDLVELFTDADVDMVYIASPNSLHFEQSYQALSYGKHVICEKPFTSTVRETKALIKHAEDKSLMLFEAIKNIHLPNFEMLQEHIHHIGNIKFVQCNYSKYSSRYDELLNGGTPNVFNLKFSGGALADLNIYNLHFVVRLFGEPTNIHYIANKHENGVDTSGVAVMKYPGFIAECVAGKDAKSVSFVIIQGEKGFIHVKNGSNGLDEVVVNIEDQTFHLNNQVIENHLYYELQRFKEVWEQKDLNGAANYWNIRIL